MEHTRERHYTVSHDLNSFETESTCSPSIMDPQKDQCEPPRKYESAMQIIRRARSVLRKAGFDECRINAIVVTGINPQAYWVKTVLSNAFPWTKATDTTSVTPETAIVYGAALFAHAMSADDKELCTLHIPDLTVLSIGIETEHGQFTEITPMGCMLPLRRREFFETSVSGNQEGIEYITAKFYEGERLIAKENRLLGTVELQTARNGRTGLEVEVRIDVDDDGVMEGRVKEINVDGGSEARTEKISLRTIYNCDRGELNAIRMDAERHYYEDLEILQQRRREVAGNGLRLIPDE